MQEVGGPSGRGGRRPHSAVRALAMPFDTALGHTPLSWWERGTYSFVLASAMGLRLIHSIIHLPYHTLVSQSLSSVRLTSSNRRALLHFACVLHHRSRRCRHLNRHYGTYTVGRTSTAVPAPPPVPSDDCRSITSTRASTGVVIRHLTTSITTPIVPRCL